MCLAHICSDDEKVRGYLQPRDTQCFSTGDLLCAVCGQDPNQLLLRGMLGLAVVPVCDSRPPLCAQAPQMPMALCTCPTRRWSLLLEAWCSAKERPSGSWRSWLTRRASCRTHGTRWAPPHVWCHCGCGSWPGATPTPHLVPGPQPPWGMLHKKSLKPLHLPPRCSFLGWLGESVQPAL